MKISAHPVPQPPVRRTLAGPSEPVPPPPPPDPETVHHLRSEAFLKGASRAARTLSQVGGFTNGASLGYLVGSLVAAGAGATGPATFVTALAGAGGGGVLGWKAMGHASDWAGHKGSQLYRKDPLAGEAVGRATLNLAVDLLSGSRFNTVADLGITAGWGWHKAHQAEKRFLKGT